MCRVVLTHLVSPISLSCFATLGAMFDLAPLFGAEFFFSFGCASGHDAAEWFNFGDDGRELVGFDISSHLLSWFIGDRAFRDIWKALVPTCIDVLIRVVDGFSQASEQSCARKVASSSVGRKAEIVGVIFSEGHQDGFSHVEGDEPDEWASGVVIPCWCGSFAVEKVLTLLPDKIVFIAKGSEGTAVDAL